MFNYLCPIYFVLNCELLSWFDRLKNDDIHQKYDFLINIIFTALEHL